MIRRRSVSSFVSPGPRPPIPAPPGSPAAGLTRQVATPAAESLLEVLQLGQLDLGLALGALGVLGEDVEDQCGPVDHLDLDPILQVAQLRGRELAVTDHRVGTGGDHHLAQLLDLAAPDVRGRVGSGAALDQALEHLGAGGLGEQLELGHRILRVDLAARRPHAHQHDPLEQELAILDLGDVGELGGHPGDPAERVALLQVELVPVMIAVRPGSPRGRSRCQCRPGIGLARRRRVRSQQLSYLFQLSRGHRQIRTVLLWAEVERTSSDPTRAPLRQRLPVSRPTCIWAMRCADEALPGLHRTTSGRCGAQTKGSRARPPATSGRCGAQTKRLRGLQPRDHIWAMRCADEGLPALPTTSGRCGARRGPAPPTTSGRCGAQTKRSRPSTDHIWAMRCADDGVVPGSTIAPRGSRNRISRASNRRR